MLDRLVPIEREVSAANGRHYARRVLPYRTTDNRIDGVVITFVDITDRKRAEQDGGRSARVRREHRRDAARAAAGARIPDLTVNNANAAFYRDFR